MQEFLFIGGGGGGLFIEQYRIPPDEQKPLAADLRPCTLAPLHKICVWTQIRKIKRKLIFNQSESRIKDLRLIFMICVQTQILCNGVIVDQNVARAPVWIRHWFTAWQKRENNSAIGKRVFYLINAWKRKILRSSCRNNLEA